MCLVCMALCDAIMDKLIFPPPPPPPAYYSIDISIAEVVAIYTKRWTRANIQV